MHGGIRALLCHKKVVINHGDIILGQLNVLLTVSRRLWARSPHGILRLTSLNRVCSKINRSQERLNKFSIGRLEQRVILRTWAVFSPSCNCR